MSAFTWDAATKSKNSRKAPNGKNISFSSSITDRYVNDNTKRLPSTEHYGRLYSPDYAVSRYDTSVGELPPWMEEMLREDMRNYLDDGNYQYAEATTLLIDRIHARVGVSPELLFESNQIKKELNEAGYEDSFNHMIADGFKRVDNNTTVCGDGSKPIIDKKGNKKCPIVADRVEEMMARSFDMVQTLKKDKISPEIVNEVENMYLLGPNNKDGRRERDYMLNGDVPPEFLKAVDRLEEDEKAKTVKNVYEDVQSNDGKSVFRELGFKSYASFRAVAAKFDTIEGLVDWLYSVDWMRYWLILMLVKSMVAIYCSYQNASTLTKVASSLATTFIFGGATSTQYLVTELVTHFLSNISVIFSTTDLIMMLLSPLAYLFEKINFTYYVYKLLNFIALPAVILEFANIVYATVNLIYTMYTTGDLEVKKIVCNEHSLNFFRAASDKVKQLFIDFIKYYCDVETKLGMTQHVCSFIQATISYVTGQVNKIETVIGDTVKEAGLNKTGAKPTIP